MTRVSLAVVLATALAVPVIPAGQHQAFRGGIHTVSIYASAVDRSGRLRTDLTKEDFEVFDDGKRQPLTLFTNDLQPITIVVMLDRSGSVSQHFELVREAAERFVLNLDEDDRARIGSFSNRVQVDPPEFTNDQDALIRILRENLQDEGPTPLWNATAAAMDALAPEQGRRVVLMFTDGYDNPPLPDANTTFGTVRERAQVEEVMVYGIGLAEKCASRSDRGAFGPVRFQRRPPSGPGRGRGGLGRPPRLPIPIPLPGPIGPGPSPRYPGRGDPRGGRPPGVTPTAPCSAEKPDPSLHVLAVESGGGYFELDNTQHLASTFARVANELHQQYLLGFSPATLDGRMHTLEVRVRRSGVTVRARKSYLAVSKGDGG
ncbi:MAG TPA: VWA domain-containing protein [Vicinamibacterales bacterium]|nr:VWA domain-containing protein [Vicinamibacterales bacterium]